MSAFWYHPKPGEPVTSESLTIETIQMAALLAASQYSEPDQIIIHPDMVLPFVRRARAEMYYYRKMFRLGFEAGFRRGRTGKALTQAVYKRKMEKAFEAYCFELAERDFPDKQSALDYIAKKG